MQRDKQMKLSKDVQRQAASSSKTSTTARPARSTTTPSDGRHVERESAYRSQTAQTRRASNGGIVSAFATEAPSAVAQRILQGNRASPAYVPRERVEASMMAASNYTRRSSSPSESVMTSTMQPGGYSRNSGVEESYYLMRNAVSVNSTDPGGTEAWFKQDDPDDDPMMAFLATIDGMVEKLGHAVAFASAPVAAHTALHSTSTPTADLSQRRAMADKHSSPQSDAAVQESFYLIPTSSASPSAAPTAAVQKPFEPDRSA